MDADAVRARRLRAHALSHPVEDVTAAARRLTATQAQEFWGGRWALAVRASGDPPLADVDAAFDRGEIVRSWTQRGTLHIVPAEDVRWMLAVTAARQTRQAASVHGRMGIPGDLVPVATAVSAALAGGNRLTRAEFGDVIAASGIDPAQMRGGLVLWRLSVAGVTVLGPVVPREDGPSRDQYVVAMDDWIPRFADPDDPLAELLVRYLRGHGPATLADFRWWAGLPLGLAREARERAGGRVVEVEEGLLDEAGAPGDAPGDERDADPAAASDVFALPPFEEYYLSYADRTLACPPERKGAVGPGPNGAVKPILVSDGEVVGTWKHSQAAGRRHLAPQAELFAESRVAAASVDAALERFARFIGG